MRQIGPLLLVTTACTAARPLVPLGAGEVALEGSIPAVLVAAEPPIPVGNVAVGARVGVTDSVEARLTLHPMHLFLKHRQILGIGAGGAWHLSPADGWVPALHFTADLTLFAPLGGPHRPGEPRLMAVVDAAVITHWEPLDWAYPYLLLDVAARTTDGPPINSLYGGVQLWPKGRVSLSLELGWFAFSVDEDDLTTPYVSPGYGALYVGGAISIPLGEREQ